jgi:hypothetical protein
VTIFYHEVTSKPDSSACKATVAVADGEDAVWKDGKPVTRAELARMREQEEHFVRWMFPSETSQVVLAWRNPKPIGDPCPDTSGHAPTDIADRYKGQNCSIVVVYDNGYVMFVNWKVVGRIDATGVEVARDVVQTISAQYGSKYVVHRAY